MNDDQNEIIEKITDNSLVFIAILGIPIATIVYFALKDTPYQLPRYIPTLLELVYVEAAILKKKIPLRPKIRGFIAFLFLTGCYTLVLGLIDMASLWFVLAIVYTLLISEKQEALVLFAASFLSVLVAGILMMTKIFVVPLDYDFKPCHFACVSIRMLHFLMIGSLVYYILGTFYREVRQKVADLREQSKALEYVNLALERESHERKIAQQKVLETVILTEEEERKRLAADLHDGIGPVLATIKLFFQAYIDAGELDQKLPIEERLKTVIDTAIRDVSRIAHNISPHILEQFGFVKALEAFTDAIASSSAVVFSTDFGNIGRFDLKRELTLYRTLTELIHNTLKHAGAYRITIRCASEGGVLTASYTDNGRGFGNVIPEGPCAGMGLSSLRNRIRSLGGTITIRSAPSDGMSAQIEIPLTDGFPKDSQLDPAGDGRL